MHSNSLALMKQCLSRIPVVKASLGITRVLDIASFDVNGTYRPLVQDSGAFYTGADIVPGPNVDLVLEDPYCYPFRDGYFDAVICGNALHNMDAFWRVIPEMARVTVAGGVVAVVAPTGARGVNRHPVDRWRFTAEGIEYLFDMCGNLGDYQIVEQELDVCGSAIKR